MIPLSVPFIKGNESKYVLDCLNTGWISSAGSYVDYFEQIIKNYTKSKHAVACMNGTTGLHISLVALDVKENDYVIVPNLTFVASLNSIKHAGAEPIMIDVDKSNWQIDLNLLDEFLKTHTSNKIINGKKSCVLNSNNRQIKCIMPVHVLGNMCNMRRLIKIAKKYNLFVLEDSTEALGSFSDKKHSGTFGDLGVFSFNGNKIISTGGGGMIITDNSDLANKIKHLTTQAKISKNEYIHDAVGYNYRLVNVLSAIGVAQMEYFDEILKNKKKIDTYYRKNLSKIKDTDFYNVNHGVKNNCWLFTFRTHKMRELLKYLNNNGIQSRPFWMPMNQLPMFKTNKYYTKNDISNELYETCISIPSSANLGLNELSLITKKITEFLK